MRQYIMTGQYSLPWVCTVTSAPSPPRHHPPAGTVVYSTLLYSTLLHLTTCQLGWPGLPPPWPADHGHWPAGSPNDNITNRDNNIQGSSFLTPHSLIVLLTHSHAHTCTSLIVLLTHSHTHTCTSLIVPLTHSPTHMYLTHCTSHSLTQSHMHLTHCTSHPLVHHHIIPVLLQKLGPPPRVCQPSLTAVRSEWPIIIIIVLFSNNELLCLSFLFDLATRREGPAGEECCNPKPTKASRADIRQHQPHR